MSQYRWPSFKQQLGDFFADFRDMLAALKRREGQAAFLLLFVTLATCVGVFLVVLGFDRLSDLSPAGSQWCPFRCRTPDDRQSLFIIIGGVTFTLLALMTMGETMLFIDRKRRRRPGRAAAVLVPAALMLAMGVFGAISMRFWC